MRRTNSKNDGMHDEKSNGLVALQERLEDAATAVKATTTAMRNRNRFTVQDEIKEMAAEAAKCRDPVRRKLPRKSVRKPRREFDAGGAALSGGKVIHRPVVTKLWVRTEMSGQKKSEPIVKSAMMTRWRRQRCRLRGSETREVVVIAWSHFRAGVYGSQWTGFSVPVRQ